MSNHWCDLDNASLFYVMGANPVENHPASMAHVNAARYGTKKARLVVVDPRKTRTAQQADLFVRIRPGTDIAFINGVINYILTTGMTNNTTFRNNFNAWHNSTDPNFFSAGRTFRDNAGGVGAFDPRGTAQYGGADAPAFVGTASLTAMNRGWPKYTDSRFLVATGAAPTDYQRATLTNGSRSYANFPVLADTIDDENCVMSKLKVHVAPYTAAVVADICGCDALDVAAVGDEFIANSRMMSTDFSDALCNPTAATYKATTIMYAMGTTQHTYGSQNVRSYAVIQSMLGNMGRPGGGINALRGIHNVQGSTDMGVLFDLIPGYSGNPATGSTWAGYIDPLFGNRANAAASGGAVNAYVPSGLGLQQRGFYNMTSAWFAVPDGAGTLYASGDIDKMYALWPKGNGNDHITGFRAMRSGTTKAAVVWGQNPANTEPNQSMVREGLANLDLLVVVDTFETETAACRRKANGVTYLLPACSYVEEAGSVTNSGRWIQWRQRARLPHGNSRADLELLLRFAKALDVAGAFGHITTQWGTMAASASLGSDAYKTLYGDQYGYNGVGDFNAVSGTVLDAYGAVPSGTVLGSEAVAEKAFIQMGKSLATGGTLWIWTEAYNTTKASARPAGLGDLQSFVEESKALTGTTAVKLTGAALTTTPIVSRLTGGGGVVYAATDYTLDKFNGTIVRTSGSAIPDGGTVFIATYTGRPRLDWTTCNRAKSRNNTFKGEALSYPRWGYSWLVNRRVLYNNSEVPSDEADTFVAPDVVARLFTVNVAGVGSPAVVDYAYTYRAYNTLKDVPSKGVDTLPAKTDTTKPHKYAGRFPAHTEPTETPRRDLANVYGRNLSVSAALVKDDTKAAMWSSTDPVYAGDAFYGNWAAPAYTAWAADAKDYPLVLTTIRCVEHFQGGPITRNNSWNVEAEPVPWIEINSVDARVAGIQTGDWVNVITARSNSTTEQEGRTPKLGASPAANKTDWAHGFKARVGVGLQGNQRVAPGVVAIPWHWGDQGLGTGSRANDLCIDSYDANTIIPEYKACLCKIVKLP
jgi:anaerobic selenocysteine-containing dehydrogenase